MRDQMEALRESLARDLKVLSGERPFTPQARLRLRDCLDRLTEVTAKIESLRRQTVLRVGALGGAHGVRATALGVAHQEFLLREMAHWDQNLAELRGRLWIEGQLLLARSLAEEGQGEAGLEALGRALSRRPDSPEALELLGHPGLPKMGAALLRGRYRLDSVLSVPAPGAGYLADISVLPDHGRVYLSDSQGGVVLAFDLSGRPLGPVGRPFKLPNGLCGTGGLLAVCEQGDSRIVLLDRHGREVRSIDVMEATAGALGPLAPAIACPVGLDMYVCCLGEYGQERLLLLRLDSGSWTAHVLELDPGWRVTGLHHCDGALFVLCAEPRGVAVLRPDGGLPVLHRFKAMDEIPVKLRGGGSNFFLTTDRKLCKLDGKLDTVFSVPIPTRPYNDPNSAFARLDLCAHGAVQCLYVVDDMLKGYCVLKV
uniref:Uncharacterized protein n=1 Tax=Desulfovibrio sp. U5L TaxID=596152 RepID=I2Q7K7_9BACT